jgi:hypothetical protein
MQATTKLYGYEVPTFLTTPLGMSLVGLALLTWTLIWARIFSRTGAHGAMGLLMLVPVVNVILLFVLAFGSWPLEKEVRSLRRVQRAARQAEDRFYTKAA